MTTIPSTSEHTSARLRHIPKYLLVVSYALWALGDASTGSYAVCSASDSVAGAARVTVVTRSVRSRGVQPGARECGVRPMALWVNTFVPQHDHCRLFVVPRCNREPGKIVTSSFPG